jgi:hypothetical protein
MAETTTKPNGFVPDLDAAAERVRETNDRIGEAGRKLTIAYLDGVEQYAAGVARAERKLGEQSQFEAVANLLGAHADLTEDLVKASVSATRELITV